MARIYAPVKDYNGISAGVSFRDGVGETSSPNLLKWFQKHGYRVEEVQENIELEADKKAEQIQEDIELETDKKRSRKQKE